MRLSDFILENLEQIIGEWEAFAMTLLPAAASMSRLQLRDHAREILQAIAADIQAPQSEQQRLNKSRDPVDPGMDSAAAIHGGLRHEVGFDIQQLNAEFRALRASVLRLWMKDAPASTPGAFEDMLRFNEAVDQALAESVARYADDMDRSRNIFLAILGHDLRTPLGAITMTTQHMRMSQPAPEKREEALMRIERSALAMGGMIRDLLEFTRGSLGRGIPVTLLPTDAGTICAAALDEVRSAYPQQAFRMEADGELGLLGDADRLRQLLWNLLSNAAQHGARDCPVSVTLRGEQSRILLQVRNQGRPIPADALQIIFNPLVRQAQEGSGKSPAANLGLGLYIAREITHAHGGEIGVASSEQQGTLFTVALPRHPAAGH